MRDHLLALVRDEAPLKGRNVAREYLQARILGAMQNAGATASLAFQGGTCLRFVFALPRYSEDLDFALEGDRVRYDLGAYLAAARRELAKENYQVELRLRERRTVHSGMVRFPGLLHALGLSPHATEVLAIKVEVDTNPPADATTAVTLTRRHMTLRLCHHDRATLLAGKLHAVLQRRYAKGRDLHDLIWYLSDPGWPPPNLAMLNAALDQSGWERPPLTPETWRAQVRARVAQTDWRHAVQDVRPFLERDADAALISQENALRLLGQD